MTIAFLHKILRQPNNQPKLNLNLFCLSFSFKKAYIDISQNKLGEMIGLDWGAMSRTLSGKRAMKHEEVSKVAEIFQVPL